MLKETWNNYTEYLREIKWPFEPKTWLIISIVLAIALGVATWILVGILQVIPMKFAHGLLFSLIILIVTLDITLAYPYLLAVRRISQIEEALPDAFKQMADTLKAGGTFEYALRSVSSAEYGPLTEETNLILRRLEEGENLENSMRAFANNVNSKVVKRAVTIILDSIAAGASLADILDEIADDVRATHRIMHERKSSTLMQVLFMVTAGAIVAPFIFGLVTTIVEFLMSQSISAFNIIQRVSITEITMLCGAAVSNPDKTVYWNCIKESITMLLVCYIIIEAIAVGFMVSMIREGNASKSFIYIPVFLLIAYLVYYMSYIFTIGFFGR